jgi:hypothetical protein
MRLRVRFIEILQFGCRGIVEGIIVRNQFICVSDGAPQRPISGTFNVLAAIVPSIILFEGIPIISNKIFAYLFLDDT